MMTPVHCEPAVACAPDQAPEAVQLVAFVDDQVIIELPPLGTVVGLAVIDTVGAVVPPELPNTTDFVCHPSPPPILILQSVGSPPPTSPVQMPTAPVLGMRGLVVHEAAQAETSWGPTVTDGQYKISSESVTSTAFFSCHCADHAQLAVVVALGFVQTNTAIVTGVVSVTLAELVVLPPVPVQLRV